MARYLFFSHDGFGLGHVRRNTLVARALLGREPEAEVAIVTGLAVQPTWAGPLGEKPEPWHWEFGIIS